MAIKSQVDFSVDLTGELTDNKYPGVFTVKCKLSMRESLKQDEIYRSILGPDSQNANPGAKSVAAAISYLATHVIKSPDWWTALEGGMRCEDMNVLAEVNNKAQEAIEAEYKKLAEEGKKAEDILKSVQAAT
jgi:hypothetical protein